MESRLQRIIESERITPARFAEILGVQRSAISHILTGRNKPSFDLISKIIIKFPSINAEWLITGKGEMRKVIIQRSIFDEIESNDNKISTETENIITPKSQDSVKVTNVNSSTISPIGDILPKEVQTNEAKDIKKIVILYSDNTFEEYRPSSC